MVLKPRDEGSIHEADVWYPHGGTKRRLRGFYRYNIIYIKSCTYYSLSYTYTPCILDCTYIHFSSCTLVYSSCTVYINTLYPVHTSIMSCTYIHAILCIIKHSTIYKLIYSFLYLNILDTSTYRYLSIDKTATHLDSYIPTHLQYT